MEKRSQRMAKGAYNLGKKLVHTKLSFFTLKFKIILGAALLAIGLLVVLAIGIVSSVSTVVVGASSEDNAAIYTGRYLGLTPEVEQYREDVTRELKKLNKEQYVEIILAIIQQESSGIGNDPMQASESKCGKIGCITNPQESIQQGIKHFLRMVDLSDGDVQLALQSYNFGSGFISYAKKNGGIYTYEIAVSYSQMMYEKLKYQGIYKCHRPEAIMHNACYGDILYVQSVMQYMGVNGANGNFTPLDYNKLRVTSAFGYRTLDRGLEHHNGIDYACVKGVDRVYAVQDGKVIYSGKHSGAASYGNFVTIQHHDTFYTTYAHLDSVNVKPWDQISGGTIIGICGNTGRSFGAHLHFETKTQLWRGHYNPEPFVNDIVHRILLALESEDEPSE